MLIEEKANAYDNALNKAKQLLSKCKRVSDKVSMIYRAEDIESMFPELKESEDEKIRKDLIKWCEEFPDLIWRGHDKNKVLAWLKKQGEQKSVEDFLTFEEFENAFITKAKQYDIDLPNRSWDIYALCKELYSLKHKPKQGEQKPFDYENSNIQQKDFAPKVEPKFKVGDWIVNEFHDICLITDIDLENGYYICKSNRFNNTEGDIDLTDKEFHHWNIQNAKDGDILITENEKPFIFKGLDICHSDKPIAYGGITDSGYFNPSSNNCTNRWTDGNACPATKEQCDLLFRKIKEAGFKWNKNKKVLKRI